MSQKKNRKATVHITVEEVEYIYIMGAMDSRKGEGLPRKAR